MLRGELGRRRRDPGTPGFFEPGSSILEVLRGGGWKCLRWGRSRRRSHIRVACRKEPDSVGQFQPERRFALCRSDRSGTVVRHCPIPRRCSEIPPRPHSTSVGVMSSHGESLPPSETVARFIPFESRVRADGTVKPEAFMPPMSLELSVTRVVERDELDIWARGRKVAAASAGRLVGRADISVPSVRQVAAIDVVAAPLADDPAHAHIVGWPTSKPEQKLVAMDLAVRSVFKRVPSAPV